ncbi:MAG TPA: cupin domain-containing protein [bacterium]|nr:cupin domain-containing protein [bacterium]
MERIKWQDVPAETPEGMPGVRIHWVIDKTRGAENFAMRVFEVAPGASTPYHHHWYEQEMYFLEGEGVAVSPQGEQLLTPGNVLWVQPEEPHAIRNTGSVPMKFICCVPTKKS